MGNLCGNKLVVYGPEASVRQFVEAARGKTYPSDANLMCVTEKRVIAEVKAGKSVAEAFRDANNRIDALLKNVERYPLTDHLLTHHLDPVSEEEFAAWEEEIGHVSARMEEYLEAAKETSLSLFSLVPIPEIYMSESYHYAMHAWLMDKHGTKGIDEVDEPELLPVSASLAATGDVIVGSGETMAVYPIFSSDNSPPFRALLNMGPAHPDVTFLAAFVDENTEEFKAIAVKGSEILATVVVDEAGDFPEDCFVDEDGEMLLRESKALDHLVERASMEIDEYNSARKISAPGPRWF